MDGGEGQESYADGVEQEISLKSGPIWIYLTYQTAFVDDQTVKPSAPK